MEVPWNIIEPTRLLHTHTATSLVFSMLLGVWSAQALEMNTGKIPFLEAVNGSTVTIPCTYASCIGIENMYFNWQFNDNGTMQKVAEGTVPDDGIFPEGLKVFRERVEYAGVPEQANVSIIIWNITFDDQGQYHCFGRNPKEKGRNHTAVFTLYVVDELKVVDNTLTIIIASCVGGGIAALMGFMLIKNFIIYVLQTLEERKNRKECLVSSSGNDNTGNSLSGSKADSKPTPKKK